MRPQYRSDQQTSRAEGPMMLKFLGLVRSPYFSWQTAFEQVKYSAVSQVMSFVTLTAVCVFRFYCNKQLTRQNKPSVGQQTHTCLICEKGSDSLIDSLFVFVFHRKRGWRVFAWRRTRRAPRSCRARSDTRSACVSARWASMWTSVMRTSSSCSTTTYSTAWREPR